MKFPDHKAGLSLHHDEHKTNRLTAAEWIADGADGVLWVSKEQKQKAIATDSIWMITWYPETPVGSWCFAAADLDVLLEYVNRD